MQSEVSLGTACLWWFGLAKHWVLAKMVVIQFVLEGSIGGFREHALFFKDGQDTHWLWLRSVDKLKDERKRKEKRLR